MRIYLSGPITGVENYRENFRMAAERLAGDGITDVINPAELCQVLPLDHTTWEEYLQIDLHLMDLADCLVLFRAGRSQRDRSVSMATPWRRT